MTLTIQRAIFTERAGIIARDIRAGEDNKKVYDNGITMTKDLERYRDEIVINYDNSIEVRWKFKNEL